MSMVPCGLALPPFPTFVQVLLDGTKSGNSATPKEVNFVVTDCTVRENEQPLWKATGT